MQPTWWPEAGTIIVTGMYYGHLADLQKKLLTTDLIKKTLHLIKYLLTILFFPFFSICTCLQLQQDLIELLQKQQQWKQTKCFQRILLEYFTQYRRTSSISRTLVGNKIVDNSDVVGAAPTGNAPTTSSFSNLTPGFNGLSEESCKRIQETFKFWNMVWLILEVLR